MANSCGNQFTYAGFTEGMREREGGSLESLGPVEVKESKIRERGGVPVWKLFGDLILGFRRVVLVGKKLQNLQWVEEFIVN